MEKTINDFEIHEVDNVSYVLTECKRLNVMDDLKYPNFMGTGMALSGILKKNEAFEHWFERREKVKQKNRKLYGTDE